MTFLHDHSDHLLCIYTQQSGLECKKKQLKSFDILFRLDYSCKDFLFRTWLHNRLQRTSIFPLAGNPKISFTTLKTFCLQSIRHYSPSHKRHDNNCQQPAETYWCKDRSGSVSLMWLSLSQQHNPQVKVNFKSCNSWAKIFQLHLRGKSMWTIGNHRGGKTNDNNC